MNARQKAEELLRAPLWKSVEPARSVIRELLAEIKTIKKHDCEKLLDEARGCSICSAMMRHTVADAKEMQSYINAEISKLKRENEALRERERQVATLMCEWKTGRIDGDTLADRLFSLFASEPAIGSDTDRLRKETAKRCVEIAQVFCRESAWCRPNKPCAPCQIANSIATEFGL